MRLPNTAQKNMRIMNAQDDGHDREADGLRRFVERTAVGSADEVQVVFGVEENAVCRKRRSRGSTATKGLNP